MTTPELLALLGEETARPVPEEVRRFAESLMHRGAVAVLFYGSGLWKGIDEETMLDFYVLCDDLKAYGLPRLSALVARLLPPNVYYRENLENGRARRAKIAVMHIEDFRAAARGRSVTPQIWARFCQPCRLAAVRDDAARRLVIGALAEAVMTFHRASLPLVCPDATSRALWSAGFGATFGYELRSEDRGRAAAIYDAAPDAYLARSEAVRASLGLARPASASALKMRQGLGKLIHLLRLMKASFTFAGGIDYLLWKIERHSGVRIEATDFQRRHPLLGGWPLLWRLYRKKGFR